jgi:hypothetical protein
MSEQTISELIYPVNLDNRHRGQLAELAFMRKAASLGFAVAKPYGEGERYDIVVCVDNVFWRVQVKSVRHTSYSANEIDFLVAYIFQEDVWYVFPATVIENRKALCVTPGSKRSRFEQYREAWKLMRPTVADSKTAADNSVGTAAAAVATAAGT